MKVVCFLFLVVPLTSWSQLDETTLPASSFLATDSLFQEWENYFDRQFFSTGAGTEALKEGSGYLPYVRERQFYDLRKNILGQVSSNKRWEIYKQLRQKALDRNDPSPAADWQPLGPNKMEEMGGRMISFAIEPENSQVLWAGSASGGLWLSENGGEFWKPMTDQIPSTGIGAIAVNPLNPNHLLIGTGEGYALGGISIRAGLGVFKSIDKGLTWQQTQFDYLQSAGVSVFKIIWNQTDTNTVWIAATNGIWKSSDAGQTWTLKKGDGTNHGGSVFTDLLQHPNQPETLYAALKSDGIWRSDDGGETWLKLVGGLPTTDLNYIRITQCKSQPAVMYASISSGQSTGWQLRGVFRSSDEGENWIKLESAPNAFCPPNPPAGASCQGWYDNIIAVAPHNPDIVWFGGASLWRSIDGGQNWTQHDYYACPNCSLPQNCRTYVDQHDFAFDPQDTQTLYVFNDGGISKSTNGGDCWERKNEGLITAQFYAIAAGRSDPNTIVAATQDHGLQGVKLAENTNFAWDRWGYLDGSDVEVHASISNTLYGSWVNGTYWRTSGGVHVLATQTTNGINLAENAGFFFAPLRQRPGFPLTLLGATQQRLYKTTNGGSLWMPVQSMSQPKVFEFDQQNSSIAYAASWNNAGARAFWISQDAGSSWQETPQNPGWRVTDIKSCPLQQGLVYVSRNSNLPNVAHIYKSTDAGNSWTPIQGNLPDLPVNAIAVHHFIPGTVFAATDLGVFITCDDGQTWSEYNHNLPITFVLDIQFNPADTTLLVGTLGRGAWRTKAWMPTISPAVEAGTTNQLQILNIIPNPSNAITQIAWRLNTDSQVRVEILNPLGQRLGVLFQGVLQAGIHETTWNGILPNGIKAVPGLYFIRVSSAHQALMKQLIRN